MTLSRNDVFNIIKEKTTSDLLKALSNMYEKPSAMNKRVLDVELVQSTKV